ncbi:hypothetical protein MJO29_007749 [Puccinia striiformis f. sp. tritici]|uniref:hypothetical protein n=2 Tax=Puccinia striiformis f. sp. tritici TaxID=168172 RepID=UPI00200829C5|nr:hypothetical protein Pst134EA_013922 [Puccinia striiformis f. sp. tritici]KAH9466075.1 hypothetical protein Pst134EA_013922 [Puccinia striiformis f. sp. tritici]KAI7956350.1 hypothetical protein MJO29_007749 [Puccinia striiformis f. sp. tritici]
MNVKNQTKEQATVRQPLYELSTQFRHWRFSQSGLELARRELNEGAVGRVKSKLEEERNVEIPSTEPGTGMIEEPSQIEYLTVQDELELVTFYLSKISQLCRASIFNFPETVEATAMSYLKRFYLRNTCMDYHPKNIMLTCLFLATKTENTSISIDSFASRIPKTTNEDVLALEFLVAQSLKFQFKVHHSHLAARGIYLDLQTCPSLQGQAGINQLTQAWPEVCGLLRAGRLTDLEFLWTPSQIACAAWWIVDKPIIEIWLKLKSDRLLTTPPLTLNPLINHLNSISQNLNNAKFKPIDKDRVTAVDRRLRFCRNPEKDPNSNLFKIRKAQIENDSIVKHHQKYPVGANHDPFS